MLPRELERREVVDLRPLERFAPPLLFFAALDRLVPPLLRAATERVAPPVALERLAERLAELELDFLVADDRLDVPLEPDELERERELPARALLLAVRDVPDEPSSSLHRPESTRCAASATASAINAPSRVALETAALAALLAVSAASRPASRILRRAAGLALIAAAAAASPAASISRLIAALAILSTVLFPEPGDLDEPDDFVVLLDLAIAWSPSVALSRERHFKAVTVP